MTHPTWPLSRARLVWTLYRLPSYCGHVWLAALPVAILAVAMHAAVWSPWTGRLHAQATGPARRVTADPMRVRAAQDRPGPSRGAFAPLSETPARILTIVQHHGLTPQDVHYRRTQEPVRAAGKATPRTWNTMMNLPLSGTYPDLRAALREISILPGLTVQTLSTDRRGPDQTRLAIALTLQWPEDSGVPDDALAGRPIISTASDLFPYQGPRREQADPAVPAAAEIQASATGRPLAAPPLPFTFAGVWSTHAGARRLVLLSGPRSVIVCAHCRDAHSIGAVLQRYYRIDHIDAGQIVFTYLPLGTPQTLSLDPPPALK